MSYAQGTSVSVERSKAEVEKILARAGADQFSSGWSTNKAVLFFRLRERYIRIEMPLPKAEGKFNSKDRIEAENRRRWRAMVLYIKAKLESVESSIVTFEEAFMAHVVLPNRQTVGEFMAPQIESAYKDGKMSRQLPGY